MQPKTSDQQSSTPGRNRPQFFENSVCSPAGKVVLKKIFLLSLSLLVFFSCSQKPHYKQGDVVLVRYSFEIYKAKILWNDEDQGIAKVDLPNSIDGTFITSDQIIGYCPYTACAEKKSCQEEVLIIKPSGYDSKYKTTGNYNTAIGWKASYKDTTFKEHH